MLLVILIVKKSLERFKRQMKGATKTNETDLNVKKVIRKNPINLRQMKGL